MPSIFQKPMFAISLSALSLQILLSTQKTLPNFFLNSTNALCSAMGLTFFLTISFQGKKLLTFLQTIFLLKIYLHNYDLQQFCLYNTKVSKFGISARKTFTLEKKPFIWGSQAESLFSLGMSRTRDNIQMVLLSFIVLQRELSDLYRTRLSRRRMIQLLAPPPSRQHWSLSKFFCMSPVELTSYGKGGGGTQIVRQW